MQQTRKYLINTFLGGLLVLLPVAILIIALKFLFNLLLNLVSPISGLIDSHPEGNSFWINLLALLILVAFIFIIGVFVRTRFGKLAFTFVEDEILARIPLYNTIKDTVDQFTGKANTAFSKVALVRGVFGAESRVTAFITDEHKGWGYTIFVPTGPNPTNGLIFHVEEHQVEILSVPIETAMRSIIGVGAGSNKIVGESKAIPFNPKNKPSDAEEADLPVDEQ